MKSLYMMLFIVIVALATQWQQAALIPPGSIVIGGPSFTSDNLIIYSDQWHDGYWGADICYYNWNGSAWVLGDWVQGDVNTTDQEEEPFITYDGQHLYFQRWGSYNPRLYVADWDGSEFVNSTQLNSLINTGDTRYPSLTQDGQKLYYSHGKIYEATWSGSDWVNPILLPPEVNEGGGNFRWNVTVSPDGNEIYFTGAGSWINRLAFSQKIGGVWQQWQYCDYNINLPSNSTISSPALTYAPYATQELYFARNNSPGTLTWHALRSPVSVEPASLGQIKAVYK
jgi:Tol biopolymer transport system component